MPLILVATLTTLNMLMADEVTGPDLENTIAIALTAVFILPALVSGEDDKVHVGWMSLLKTGPVYLLFFGLMLAAVCHNPESRIFPEWNMTAWNDAAVDSDSGSGVEKDVDVQFGWQQNLNIVGVVLVWLSAVAVGANVWRYKKLVEELKEQSSAQEIRPDDDHKVSTRTRTRKPVLFERTPSFNVWGVERVIEEKQGEQNSNLKKMVSVREYAEERDSQLKKQKEEERREGNTLGGMEPYGRRIYEQKRQPWKIHSGRRTIKGTKGTKGTQTRLEISKLYQGPDLSKGEPGKS